MGDARRSRAGRGPRDLSHSLSGRLAQDFGDPADRLL